MTLRLGRRAFLQAALSQVAALSLLSQVGCGSELDRDPKNGGPDKDALPLEPVLGSYFGDELIAGARTIGQSYLDHFANGASAADLDMLLGPTRELVENSPSDDEALAAIRSAIQSDFQSRNYETLEGWTLGLTELQLCALTYIYA